MENSPAISCVPENPHEPRRGFSPLLVIATIVVVLFVLWFCPTVIFYAWNAGK